MCMTINTGYMSDWFYGECYREMISLLCLSHSFSIFSLMEAAYNGHLECVKLLVSRGASWNMCDQSGTCILLPSALARGSE